MDDFTVIGLAYPLHDLKTYLRHPHHFPKGTIGGHSSRESEVLIACLEEGLELLDGKSGLFDDGAQCSFCHLDVIGYNDSPVRFLALTKHDMTAFLTVL